MRLSTGMIQSFIHRWSHSGAVERANHTLFLTDLCDLLEVQRPDPIQAADTLNRYICEKAVAFRNADGSTAQGRIDSCRAVMTTSLSHPPRLICQRVGSRRQRPRAAARMRIIAGSGCFLPTQGCRARPWHPLRAITLPVESRDVEWCAWSQERVQCSLNRLSTGTNTHTHYQKAL